MSRLPPIEPLLEVHRRLERSGIPHALGASALLHAHGLIDHVGDWDMNTDATHDLLDPLFVDLSPVHYGSTGIHADSKMQMFDASVELIVQMAIVAEGQVVRIPTLPRTTWNGVPVGSLEAWAVAYFLLGRSEKAELVFETLQERGASEPDIMRMLDEPLPKGLAARLRGLPKV